ncbi:hypothetical protein A1QO_04070 [Vibrio genomosp. F10 str. ZF-129]|uniref:DUF4942 domain-containing protein n=1 Tax=Vibrio genomosp. F10 str. ZF-129 TaxID=1187848 RepID=A0A1E5BIP4_9VIBR|nr:DUF4942 domain-containing protein [Vibrio genomosp. F10]OEE37288.1 hypothetical protein A1QO_04070 [Vibrio genomosp. F10 str. ZF-129]
MNEVIEQKLVDTLLVLRSDLIKTYCQSVELQRQSLAIANQIERLIPKKNAGYIDDFDVVFIRLAERLGESSSSRSLPKMSFLLSLSSEKLNKVIQDVIDEHLWSVMFNRLGVFSMMSKLQKDKFTKQCRLDPLPFEKQNVEGTLRSLFSRKEEVLLESLQDSLNDLPNSFQSNDQYKFNKRIIIKNGFISYGDTFKLTTHDSLQSILGYIWQLIYMNGWQVDSNGLKGNFIWDELDTIVSKSNGDISLLDSVEVLGIEFRFFAKKTIHILMPDTLIGALNDAVARTNALPKSI